MSPTESASFGNITVARHVVVRSRWVLALALCGAGLLGAAASTVAHRLTEAPTEFVFQFPAGARCDNRIMRIVESEDSTAMTWTPPLYVGAPIPVSADESALMVRHFYVADRQITNTRIYDTETP